VAAVHIALFSRTLTAETASWRATERLTDTHRDIHTERQTDLQIDGDMNTFLGRQYAKVPLFNWSKITRWNLEHPIKDVSATDREISKT